MSTTSRPAGPVGEPADEPTHQAGDEPRDQTAAPAAGAPTSSSLVRADLPPLAPLGRRAVALVVDWGLATAVSAGFLDNHPLATLGVFALSTALLVGTLGATIGHVLLGLGVRAGHGRPPGLGRALVRTVLLCLVIPAVVWGPDGRGLHDVLAGTTITKIRGS